MADSRYTEETEVLVAVSIHNADCEWDWDDCREERRHQRAAREVLAGLAHLGVLLLLGGELREEWQAETRRPSGDWSSLPGLTFRTEAEANVYRRGHVYPTRLRRRLVHTGPWTEVSR